jgi:hypothetical protein
MSTETEIMRQSNDEELEQMNETEIIRQSNDEEFEQMNEELESLRLENEKMKKMLSTIEKINDLLTIQLNKCQCNQLFDFKLNTKLSVLRNKYQELKYDINFPLNQRINTQMIVIKNYDKTQELDKIQELDKTQQLDNSLSDDDLNLFYSHSNEDNINDNCIISEENDNKLIDKKNIIYINVDNFNNKTIGNEINLCHNYAEIETNFSDNNSGNDCEEEEDQMEYSCEYSDSKSGLLCEKKFTNKETLLNHVMRHTGDRPWFCEWTHCDYRAKHRNHLVGHVRKSHTGRFQFKCDWPGCDFRGNTTLSSTLSSNSLIIYSLFLILIQLLFDIKSLIFFFYTFSHLINRLFYLYFKLINI